MALQNMEFTRAKGSKAQSYSTARIEPRAISCLANFYFLFSSYFLEASVASVFLPGMLSPRAFSRGLGTQRCPTWTSPSLPSSAYRYRVPCYPSYPFSVTGSNGILYVCSMYVRLTFGIEKKK